MRERAVAVRYARALFVTAQKMGVRDGVAESLAGVREAVREHPDLGRVLNAPQVGEERKKELVRKVFADRVEPLLLHFLLLLIDKQRTGHLEAIGDEFRRQVEAARGLTRARVTTAVPLTDDLAGALRARLAEVIGGEIVMEASVDPAVLGGVCVTMGDRVIDGTLRTNLARLRETLAHADVR